MTDNLVIAGHTVRHYPLETAGHKGNCCGRFHIHNFPWLDDAVYQTPEALKDKVAAIEDAKERGALVLWEEFADTYDEENDTYEEFGMSVVSYSAEVVLVDSQLELWKEALLLSGFEEVQSFRNSNSGNVCHVFLCKVGGGHA